VSIASNRPARRQRSRINPPNNPKNISFKVSSRPRTILVWKKKSEEYSKNSHRIVVVPVQVSVRRVWTGIGILPIIFWEFAIADR
jgi:hypothetical protein